MIATPNQTAEPTPGVWESRSPEDVLTEFGSSEAGLSTEEAARRLAADGPNELKEGKRAGPLGLFLAQFKSVLVWVLIAAGVLSGVLGDAIDAVAILGVVVLNVAIGFYQEYSAERSIAALKKMTSPQAKVRRGDAVVAIPAVGLVTGDILELEAGDLVAADARLLSAASLRCVESALTGEAESVSKRAATLEGSAIPLGDRENMVFMGTSVATGTGRGVVVATAMRTELGKIAGLIETAATDKGTPLQKKLDDVGRILVWTALGIVAVLFGLGLLRGTPILELTLTSIGLAVAAVPEGLSTAVTVALSLGVSRMAKRRALMRKLAAVETLGSTSVICTDKTGTLTMGQMTVRALDVAGRSYEVIGEGYGPAGEVRFEGAKAEGVHAAPLLELATAFLGSNNAHLVEEGGVWKTVGDPTEGALRVAGIKAGGDPTRIDNETPKVSEIPFDSDRKRSSTTRRTPDGGLRLFVNGAPDALLERCTHLYAENGVRPLTEEDRAAILARIAAMAGDALRVLGAASRDLEESDAAEPTADRIERGLTFVGLAGMYDPPRPAAKAAVERCRGAGIRVVMITGDHPDTAAAIARELGIAGEKETALTGAELEELSDEDLKRRAPETAVYARVTAEHKLRIVRAWKANDAVVAMTGDGVNDAPAIVGADIGIAMGIAGTEVTKEASDMIVTDDDFATIATAVEEGRGIYDNIRKTLQFLLAGNCAELILVGVCVIVGLPAPLLAIHLLWINLVTDGLPALCLAADPVDPDVMARRPRRRSEPLTDPAFVRTMLLSAGLKAAVALAAYLFMLRTSSVEVARTYAFTALVFAELLRSFGVRSETKPVWRIPLRTNLNLVIVVALSLGFQVWSQHNETLGRFLKATPVPLAHGALLLAVAAIPMMGLELAKVVRGRTLAPQA